MSRSLLGFLRAEPSDREEKSQQRLHLNLHREQVQTWFSVVVVDGYRTLDQIFAENICPCEKKVLLGRGVVTHVDEAKAGLKIEKRDEHVK